jgi:hypothetical protein
MREPTVSATSRSAHRIPQPELAGFSAFREREEQPPPEDGGIRRSLLHRQIIREENGIWRLRVPLMARWLRLRG